MEQNKFGSYLRGLRKSRGISQSALADQAGIDFTYLSKIENDVLAPPSAATIIKMARALGADSDMLLAKAGKLPDDVKAILLQNPQWWKELRTKQLDGKT